MSRAVETAQILARPRALTPIQDDALREISHGRWEGLSRQEVEEQFPEEYATWEEDPFTFAPVGGESGISVLARALPVGAPDRVGAPGPDHVLVVSHKATLRLVLSSLLGFDPRGYRDRLDQSPACLNVVDFKDPIRARLMLFNDVSHYANQPRIRGPRTCPSGGTWDRAHRQGRPPGMHRGRGRRDGPTRLTDPQRKESPT